MKLFSVEGSGNCLKARMLLSFLGVSDYELIAPGLKPPSADLLAVNPLGQVPVLVDGSVVVRDSNAILVYLALSHRAESWYPVSDARRAAGVTQWLSYATSEVNHALLWIRIKNKFSWDIPVSYEEALQRGRTVLTFLESQISANPSSQLWLVEGDKPTIADVAVFPYVALAESSSDGAISLDDYPSVLSWVNRVKGLEGMPQMPPF